MGNNKEVICIYDETKDNIYDIMLKIYEYFTELELEREFKL